MKIALVDDDRKCLDEIILLCGNFGASTGYPIETFPFDSGEAFLETFDTGIFDLVFMDIYMKGIDGVTAAVQLRKQDSCCLLVFLTSSMEFMPNAFSCHAFEYIAKPFSKQRIFDVLSDAVKVLPHEQKYIELAAKRKTIRVFLDNIFSVVTDAHYIDITLADGERLRCRMTIPEFTDKVNGDTRFILINKGILVNAEYILTFEKGCCIMENGTQFPVRVRDGIKIEQMVRDYHFNKIRRRQANFAMHLEKTDSSDNRRRKDG